MMPIGAAQLALYTADNSGTGQVLALNEDGTLNSSSNPAPRGTVVIIPANGLDPSAQILLGGIINTSASNGTFPGIPGEIPLIRATVDPNLPASIGSLQLLPPISPGHLPVTLSIAPR